MKETNKQLIIENFSDNHLEEIYKIEEESNPTPWKKETFLQVLENRTLSFVLKKNSTIIGFCIASKLLDECHLQNISVEKAYRTKGIGTYILEILKERAKLFSTKAIFLEVRESNITAINFYKKHKFKEIGKRNNYYKLKIGREDALLMQLPLK